MRLTDALKERQRKQIPTLDLETVEYLEMRLNEQHFDLDPADYFDLLSLILKRKRELIK